VFVLFSGEQIEPFMLAIGGGLSPLQWLTSNFLHGNLLHLLGNMFFLWVFVLFIEGKLGPLKMLAVYLGIGILYGAAMQIIMLGYHEPHRCLGASAIIFGLMAMSLIWAPKNEIYGLLVVFFVLVRFKYLDIKISVMVSIALVLQLIILWLFGFSLSSQLLHVMGAVIGLIMGLVMLKMKLVDCEDWDIFSIWAGKNVQTDEERAEIEANKPENIRRRAEKRQKRQNLLSEEIELAIQNQTPLPAFVIANRKEREFSDWTLPQDLHLKMIQQLLGGKHWTEAITSMRQYLERHQEQAVFVRIMFAQALLVQNKPKSAMKILDEISSEGAQHSAIPKIRAKAEAMLQKNLDEGIYEIEE
jgi:membrane associated rhomboid family serine protease